MGKKRFIAHSMTWYKSDSIKRLIKSMDIYLLKKMIKTDALFFHPIQHITE